MSEAKKARDIKRYFKLSKERRSIPSVKTDDNGFIRIYYIRYADDFLLGIAGPLFYRNQRKDKKIPPKHQTNDVEGENTYHPRDQFTS